MNPFGAPPKRRTQLIQALQEHGPMSCAELAELLGLKKGRVSYCISEARRDHGIKYFRVHSWLEREHGAQGDYVAVFAAGDGVRKDKKRPSYTHTEQLAARREYYARNRIKLLTSQRKRRGKLPPNWFGQALGQFELFTAYRSEELEIVRANLGSPTKGRKALEEAGYIRSLASVKTQMAKMRKETTTAVAAVKPTQSSFEFAPTDLEATL